MNEREKRFVDVNTCDPIGNTSFLLTNHFLSAPRRASQAVLFAANILGLKKYRKN